MDYQSAIQAVVNQIRSLFEDKNDLRGFDDWDKLIGCVMTLENVIAQMNEPVVSPPTEE